MKKRVLGLLLSVAMSTALLAGCGSEKPAEEKKPAAADTKKEEEPEAETAKGKTQSGVVTTGVDLTSYEAGKTIRVWIPVPQSGEYQTIEDVTYDAGDAKAELTEDAAGNKMLYIEWAADAEASSRTASCSFHVTRDEVIRPELVENGEIGSDMDEYLGSSKMVVVDGVVKEKADEIVAGKTTVLDKTKAIYDWIVENMNRDNDVIGCGQGDVCTLLSSSLAGKCTDINSVFVALCRAEGIPAREMFGVRINDTDITKNQHCWAEFYLPGTGWVGADPADVLKAVLKNEWEKDSAETKEIQDYYWGNTDELRVELSSGRDLTLSPAQDGEALNDFGYPYAEVDGEVVDFYTPENFKYTILFEVDK